MTIRKQKRKISSAPLSESGEFSLFFQRGEFWLGDFEYFKYLKIYPSVVKRKMTKC
jgi:hypothetical protein